jgi:Na+/H+ antiporter NhaB
METQIWTDFLMNQAPVIIVVCIGIYAIYKHFTKTDAQKDLIIKEKDIKLEEHYNRTTDLYAKAVEAIVIGSQINQRQIEVIEETSKNVRDLTHVIDKFQND